MHKKRLLPILLCMIFSIFGAEEKKFFTTVDILDNYWKTFHSFSDKDAPGDRPRNPGVYSLENLEEMVKTLKKLGLSRLYWITNYSDIFNGANTVVNGETYLGGVELLKHMTRFCHRSGIEFFIIFKPFEMISPGVYPPAVPPPAGISSQPSLEGITAVAPFLAANPTFRLQRRLAEGPGNSRVHTILLINAGDTPLNFDHDAIQVFAGTENGVYRKITDFTLSTKRLMRKGVWTSALELKPAGTTAEDKFFLIKFKEKAAKPQLKNHIRSLVELRNNADEPIPHSIATSMITRNGLAESWQWYRLAYDRKGSGVPAEWTPPTDYGATLEKTAFNYQKAPSIYPYSPDATGYIAFAALTEKFLPGPHPAYPEVREHWLKMISKLAETSADGIDIRISSHSTWSIDGEEYGFNPNAVEEFKQRYGIDVTAGDHFDRALWRKLNGDYFTRFLRESAKTLHARKMRLHVHVSMQMLDRDFWSLNDVPAGFKWEWRKWMDEKLIDGISLKYLPFPFGSKYGKGWEYINMLIELAHKNNIEISAEARLWWWIQPANHSSRKLTDKELQALVKQFTPMMSSGLDALNFYEVSDYFMIDAYGKPRYAPEFMNLLQTLKEKK